MRGRPTSRPVDSPFILGLDLGMLHDWSALSILERDPWPWPGRPQTSEATYHLRYLDRFQLPYPDLVEKVREIAGSKELRPQYESEPDRWTRAVTARACAGPRIVLDSTGVGVAVADMFIYTDLPATIIPMTITAGHDARSAIWGDRQPWDPRARSAWWTPKRQLVSVIQTYLQTGRLTFAPGLRHGDTLAAELRNFQIRVTDHGNEVFEGLSGDFDDCVMSLAISLWLGWKGDNPVSRAGPPIQKGIDPLYNYNWGTGEPGVYVDEDGRLRPKPREMLGLGLPDSAFRDLPRPPSRPPRGGMRS